MTKVFKYGGHALPESVELDGALEALSLAIKNGEKLVIVHGGGPAINRELKLRGIETPMVNGLRKTTPEVMQVVQQVLSGEVLRNICAQLIALGINAVGLSSADGEMIRARIKNPEMGLVGEIESVNSSLLIQLLASGYTPVISPVGVDAFGQTLNLNADLVAGALGGALGAQEVLFATDVSGIYRNWPDEASLISKISKSELNQIKDEFADGMAPKVSAVLSALNSGAKGARIFDGRQEENVIAALSGQLGTLVHL